MAFGIGLALPAVTSGFSFGTFFAVASGIQTVLGTLTTVRNSRIQTKNLRTAKAYEDQRAELQRKQQQIKINRQERTMLSEKRAAIGARRIPYAARAPSAWSRVWA